MGFSRLLRPLISLSIFPLSLSLSFLSLLFNALGREKKKRGRALARAIFSPSFAYVFLG